MNKKAIMTEAIVRLILAAIAFVAVAVIVTKCYNLVAHSDAEKRFDAFTDTVTKLRSGDSTESSFSLDKDGALIGFKKNSSKVEFRLKAAGKHYYYERPTNCGAGKACFCLCKNDFDGSSSDVNVPLQCEATLKCISYDNLELDPVFPTFSLATTSDFIMEGGFIIRRGSKAIGAKTNDRVFTLKLKREKDVLTVCDSEKCG